MSLSTNFPAIRPSLNLDFANTKTLDPRITFTRSTTATYYDGVTTAMAEQNLLLYSGTVGGTSWQTYNSPTISTNNATAPDGTSTATLVTTASTAKQSIYQQTASISNNGYTMSVYAKAGTNSWIALDSGVGNTSAWFNVSAGTVGTVASGFTSSITSVGSGWYRCSITKTSSGTFTTLIGVSFPNGDNVETQTSGNTVYLWGAQTEVRTSLTAYTTTTTQPITNYIPVLQTAAANVARFDNNPTTGESLGLLIEEQRTNLLTYSEDFTAAPWSSSNVTRTANQNIAPDGTLTADLFKAAAISFGGLARTNVTYAASTTYTMSVYAKAGTWNYIGLRPSGQCVTGSDIFCFFNLATGVATTITPLSGTVNAVGMTPVGNGWYRCFVTYTTPATAPASTTDISITTASGGTNFVPAGTETVFVWGAEVEAGAFPTSYIPTTSAQVTRSADAASMTGTKFSSWYRADEYSVFANWSLAGVSPTAVQRVLTFTGSGSSNNNIRLRAEGGSANNIAVQSADAQLNIGIGVGTLSANVEYRATFGIKVNDCALTTSASSTVATDGSVTGIFSDPNTSLVIGGLNGSAEQLNGTIKKIAFYPARLTNAQLQGLTS